jgi:hypothetical protein
VIRPAVFYSLAAVVPLASLWLATPAPRAAHGMAVSPFGWPSLLIAHCLTAVPLAAVVAGWVVARVKRNSLVAAGVAGLLFAAGGYFLTGVLGEVLDSFPAEFAARCAVRSLFCFLLALPWAIAARIGSQPVRGSRVMLAVGLVVAVVLPGVWADKLAKENTDAAQDELAARRMARALPLIDGVCDLDPKREIIEQRGNLTMPAARKRLADDLKGLAEDLARTDPTRLKPSDRLLYADTLVSLDRPAEAEPILRELMPVFPPAGLSLARTLHQMRRYDESDAAAREWLIAGLPHAAKNGKVRQDCVAGFDLLGENATKRGQNAGREAVLQEGLQKMPGEEAYFRFQLGRHYKLSGRPVEAVRELEAAVRLDKRYEPAAATMIREMRELTPACLIGR